MANFWDSYGDDVIGAALALYMNGQNGKTPNQYPVQLTPEQKYWDDKKKGLFESSPTRNAINSMGTQFLGQLGGGPPAGMKFMSGELSSQPFAGGFQAPKFDMTQALAGWHTPPPPRPPTAGGGGNGGPRANSPTPGVTSGPQHKQEVGDGFGKFGQSVYDNLSENPRGSAGTPDMYGHNQGGPPNGMSYDNGEPGGIRDRAAQIGDWWTQYKAQHPNVAGAGLTGISAALALAFGLPGALAAKIAGELLNRERGAAPPPSTTTPPPSTGAPPDPNWTP